MAGVNITVGELRFTARFEEIAAPRTCAAFRTLLPFEKQLIQARWSGEAAWVPLGDLRLDLPSENATSHPSRGDILFYPGGASETELLFPYGSARFASQGRTTRREPLPDHHLGIRAARRARTAGGLEGCADHPDRIGRLYGLRRPPMRTPPRMLLERYVEAKDLARPHLMPQIYAPDAVLTFSIATDSISFPPESRGHRRNYANAGGRFRRQVQPMQDLLRVRFRRPEDGSRSRSCRGWC